jgi:hypothetical protein
MLQFETEIVVTLGRSNTGNYVSLSSRQSDIDRYSKLLSFIFSRPFKFFIGFLPKLTCLSVGMLRMGNYSN